MPDVTNQTNIKYRQSFYILALVLLIILFIYYVHKALYHCPKAKNVEQGEGKEEKKTKQETSTQYKVTDPISMADLKNIHLRKGKLYPSKPPPQSLKT